MLDFNIGSVMSNPATLKMLNTLFWVIIIIALFAAFGIMAYFLYKRYKYKYFLDIFADRALFNLKGKEDEEEPVSKSNDEIELIRFTGKGGFFKIKGAWVFKIRKKQNFLLSIFAKPHVIPPIPNKYITRNNRIMLYQIGVADYIPVRPYCVDTENKRLTFRSDEDKDLLSYIEVNDLIERQFAILETWKQYIVPAGIMIMFIFGIAIFYLLYKTAIDLAPTIQSATATLKTIGTLPPH
jgi:hypothetical protein